jgi:hypothetical protein
VRKKQKRNSLATNNSIRSKVNNLRSAFRKELRKLRNEKDVVRLQMTPTHLHYATIVYCRERATPVRNFSDTGIEGSDGQAEAEIEVKTQ